MAKSQYEYVKQFELDDRCLPQCWIVCRIDGVGFTKFTAAHSLVKPNDSRARDVMNSSARAVMREYPDICIAYGVSDEYSFVLHPKTELYSRRASKISSAIVSLFTSSYVYHWPSYFPTSPLTPSNLPYFDSRVVCYPTDESVKDYLRWRQVDCHINNLYNTCFWKLVRRYQAEQGGGTEKEARDRAHADMNSKYASSAAKNDLLHDVFQLNYNDEDSSWRKGSILLWKEITAKEQPQQPAETTNAATTTVGELAEACGGSGSSQAAASTASSPAASSSSKAPLPEASSAKSAANAPTAVAAGGTATGPSKLKRSLVLLHCDLISESFYTEEHRGIIPYQTWSDQKKREKADEKKRRKEEYRRQEKAQASERKHGSAEVSNETRKELANTQSSDKPNAASPPQ